MSLPPYSECIPVYGLKVSLQREGVTLTNQTISYITKECFTSNHKGRKDVFLLNPSWKLLPQKQSMKGEGSASHSTFGNFRNRKTSAVWEQSAVWGKYGIFISFFYFSLFWVQLWVRYSGASLIMAICVKRRILRIICSLTWSVLLISVLCWFLRLCSWLNWIVSFVHLLFYV